MPTSWWGKLLLWVYMAGYCIRLSYVGYVAWPRMSFSDWQWYMGWQSLYEMAWPILLPAEFVLGYIGAPLK